MHRVIVNEAAIKLTIRPDGPILIKAGEALAGIYPNLPDMAFVRTFARGKETVYLPGSSLKGVIRSHCERIARTVLPPGLADPPASCDPLFGELRDASPRVRPTDGRVVSCSKWLQERHRSAAGCELYRNSCLICKLFGNTSLAAHISFADAVPADGLAEDDDPNLTEERNGVGIDRVYGSVSGGALFQFEAVTRGAFTTQLLLRNFTCAHLGLVALALRDLDQQRLPIGFGKSRGLGRVRANVTDVTLRRYWAPPDAEPDTLVGFTDSAVISHFGLGGVHARHDRIRMPVRFGPDGWGLESVGLAREQMADLWRAAVGAWADFARANGGG